MKYICFKTPDNLEEIITFPITVNHNSMSWAYLSMSGHYEYTPISAGFVDRLNNCYGESITLDLKSRPHKDTTLLRKQLGI